MAMASRIKCSKNFSTALGRLTKRLMDFSIALVALSTLVIPILIVAIIITGYFKGNPFFVQRRLGYKKRVITLFKFKSMHVMHDAASIASDFTNDLERQEYRINLLAVS